MLVFPWFIANPAHPIIWRYPRPHISTNEALSCELLDGTAANEMTSIPVSDLNTAVCVAIYVHCDSARQPQLQQALFQSPGTLNDLNVVTFDFTCSDLMFFGAFFTECRTSLAFRLLVVASGGDKRYKLLQLAVIPSTGQRELSPPPPPHPSTPFFLKVANCTAPKSLVPRSPPVILLPT